MKRAIVAVVIGAAAASVIVVAVQKRARDPETSNPADLAYEERLKTDAHGSDVADTSTPEFVVSDSAMLVKTPYAIEAQMTDQVTGKGVADAPYFVELEDGRYAFGYADREGRTRSLFTRTPVKHTVFWYDEAWEHWEKRRTKGGNPR